MVEKRLILEPEVQRIFKLIDEGKNFLLSGGAGSGKTFSLVQVIQQVFIEFPSANVACMTYTNAAVREIEERVNYKNLKVSTIHDFLWDNIKHFQKELKSTVISICNDGNNKLSINDDEQIPADYFDQSGKDIQYKEYLKIKDGIISHDELLVVAEQMFANYPKLCRIVQDRYQFIFIDEYQDTSPLVVSIFLEHFKPVTSNSIVGFFGDAMQAIYDEDGIGDLDRFLGNTESPVIEVKKTQNRRNPQKIIDLANKLRTDGIVQQASSDSNAPNMLEGQIKRGELLFLHSKSNNLNMVKQHLKEKYGWDFDNAKETKELNLTHNLIAEKAGFKSLMNIYDKDPVIGLKNAIRQKIKDNISKGKPEIEFNEEDSFDSVVDKFALKNRERKLKKDVLLSDQHHASLYNQLKDKPFSEVRSIYISKDALIDDKKQNEDEESRKGSKRDNLIKHLFKIQNNIQLYKDKRYNEFLRVTDYRDKIVSIEDKKGLKEKIESLTNVGNKTIQQIIDEADEKGICLIDDRLMDFESKNEYLYNRVKNVKFSEFQKLFDYLEGKTPFSTQHKTKGTQFDNVLVVLDNGNWNKYNFENLFTGTGSSSVLKRTQKIFYVCCTRSKENLAIFYHNPNELIKAKAKEWFGEENVMEI